MGEIEHRGKDITGLAVVVAARIVDKAGANEIVVTRTVADVAAGGAFSFHEAGDHELHNVDGTWSLLRALPADRPTADR
jgi:class 3 adenylate cyclase